MTKNINIIISILGIIILNILLYSQTAGHGFFIYDDPNYVTNNELIQNVDSVKVNRIFSEFYFSNYQPLVLLTYAAQYSLFGAQAGGYHIVNLLFHILNCILVFFLIYLISRRYSTSVIVALIFCVHPLQVQAVAWISELKGLMSSSFFILSLIAYIYYLQKDKLQFYILSLLMFILALASKSMAITLPLILLLLDYYNEKPILSKLVNKIPFFALSGIFAVLAVLAQREGGAIHEGRFSSVFEYIIYPFYNIAFYIRNSVLPLKLSYYYEYARTISFASTMGVISILSIIALIVYAINFRKIRREINFGILFFLVILLPILRFIPIGHTHASDRYMYLPIIGISFAIVTGLTYLVERKPQFKKVCVGLLVVYFITFSVQTYSGCRLWKSSTGLMEDAVSKYPDNGLAHFGLAFAYMMERNREKTHHELKQAYRLQPENPIIIFGLASFYDGVRNYDEAIKLYNETVKHSRKREETYAESLTNLSVIYNKTGRPDEAKRVLEILNQSTAK